MDIKTQRTLVAAAIREYFENIYTDSKVRMDVPDQYGVVGINIYLHFGHASIWPLVHDNSRVHVVLFPINREDSAESFDIADPDMFKNMAAFVKRIENGFLGDCPLHDCDWID